MRRESSKKSDDLPLRRLERTKKTERESTLGDQRFGQLLEPVHTLPHHDFMFQLFFYLSLPRAILDPGVW